MADAALLAQSGTRKSDATRAGLLPPKDIQPGRAPMNRRRAEGPTKVYTTDDLAVSRRITRAFKICGGCKDGDNDFVRIGTSTGDGGYVMCKAPLEAASTAISIGIRGVDDWGAMISEKYGPVVHEFDCYDERPPKCPKNSARCELKFNNVCLGAATPPAEKSGGVFANPLASGREKKMRAFKPLDQMVQETAGKEGKDLVMKMDCESCEWDAIMAASNETLGRFRTIAIEFHDLANQKKHAQYVDVLEKLGDQFRLVHTHGANCAGRWRVTRANGTMALEMPTVVETTWVRKDLAKWKHCKDGKYLDKLDEPVCNTKEENYPDGFPEYSVEDFVLDAPIK